MGVFFFSLKKVKFYTQGMFASTSRGVILYWVSKYFLIKMPWFRFHGQKFESLMPILS